MIEQRRDMHAAVPEEALDMIGQERVRQYDVTVKDIKRFAQAIGEMNPLYFNEAYAANSRYGEIVAPPLFCQTFTFEDVSADELPSDGTPAELNIPLPAKRTVGGASSYEIFQRVKAGDRITVRSTLSDVFTKEGKSGTLYFIVVKTEFSNQKGEPVAKETATFIKRI